jgi:ligand-binding sensor domain-containing protein/serine phosphatase RsbU (regulator of sigma subunit)
MIRLISLRRITLFKAWLSLITCFTVFPLYSQQYNFENFTLENGLPQATIFCTFQDSRGYLWLGTEGSGVCRFDGKNFQVINQANGLSGNVVRSIIEDNYGRLWFGTDAGVSVYDGNKFISISEKRGLSSNTIVCLYRDKNNIIWVGTAGDKGGLNKVESFNSDSVKITQYTVENGLSGNSIFAICEDNYNRLWIGTFGGGITILSKEENVTPVILNRLHNFPSNHILTMSPDSINNLWIGTYDAGIIKIAVTSDLNNSRIEKASDIKETSGKTVWTVLTTQNEMWFGTNDNGIVRFMNQKIRSMNNTNGLLKNQIISLFKDREDNIWVSAGDGGLSRFMGDRFYSITKKEGLIDENVYSVAAGRNGEAWIGTYGGGLFRLSAGNGTHILKNYTVRDGLPDNVINSLSIDSHNNLWIATPKGISRFNGRNFRNFNEVKDGLANDYVNTILADKDDIIWCGTKKGVSIYDGVGFKNTKENYLPNSEVQTIMQDKSSNVWSGTLGGLAKFNGDKLTTYDEVEGLNHKKIHCLAEDKQGNIWIGTFGGGIYRLYTDSKDKQPVKQMLTDSLLNSPNVYSLIFENDTTLLAGTDKGLNRIILDNNLQVKKVFNYSFKDGFTGIKNNLNAVAKNGDEFWFGTVKGITVYRPGEDKVNNSKPMIQITGIKLFFNDVDWKKEKYETIPWTRLPQNLKLSYKKNHLTFHFVGLLFRDKEEISYQYKLEGLDKQWSPPRKENEALYPGLMPGEYTFMVVALDRYGNRSSETAEYSFIITPPFWKTKWFLLICVIVGFAAIISFIQYRERKLRKERDTLERIVKERTAEVVLQKDQIEYQRDEIQKQHGIVTEQKKDIMDSIRYAKRIQTAALSSEENIINELKDLFILYKPRDVVSGDFYWLDIEDNKIIIIAADCTGHGVPGAFTSMLGISMLNEIIGQESTTSPDIILNQLRSNIIKSLKQSADGESKDGMDIAIVTIDKNKNELNFAGAMNPLIIIRDSAQECISDSFIEEDNYRLYEIKGDKMPAAIHVRMDPFTKTTINIRSDDKFYLFSDGYEDQFGGPDYRKLMRKNLKKLFLQIHKLPMIDQKQFLEKTIEDWKGDLPQVDDILIIGFSI